jgi:hypothetical protein
LEDQGCQFEALGLKLSPNKKLCASSAGRTKFHKQNVAHIKCVIITGEEDCIAIVLYFVCADDASKSSWACRCMFECLKNKADWVVNGLHMKCKFTDYSATATSWRTTGDTGCERAS